MAAPTLQKSIIGAIQLHCCSNDSASIKEFGNSSLRLISKGCAIDLKFPSKGIRCSSQHNVILASLSQASMMDPISSISHSISNYNKKASIESALILIRHGESMWNEKNLFSGFIDVPLTNRGIEQAIEAGKRISNIPVDMIYTSALVRAQMTAMLAMTEHRCKKVPIVLHDESEQAKAWSQIFSEETMKQSIPVITSWKLNERMYGELQGLNKAETAEKYGKEKVHQWRRSYYVRPPNGESLEMCSRRAVAYFRNNIEPQLQTGRNIMVAAHANSLRAIIMYLEKLTPQEINNLELSNGVPLLYICENGNFTKRGSPVGPTEAGVYAYTRSSQRLSMCKNVDDILRTLRGKGDHVVPDRLQVSCYYQVTFKGKQLLRVRSYTLYLMSTSSLEPVFVKKDCKLMQYVLDGYARVDGMRTNASARDCYA